MPINDTEPNRYSWFPFMTVTLIFANIIVHVTIPYSSFEDIASYWDFLMRYGSTSGLIMTRQGGGMLSCITSMFLHADIFHLGSNMVFLWVFGRRVEDACGPVRFLFFYLMAGVAADLLTAIVTVDSMTPGIGASGAIFGVMGAYLLLFPGGRIRTLIFFSFIPTWPRIRAIWIALYYIGIQIVPAIMVYVNQQQYGVGYWAHIGGFFTSVFILFFLRPEAFARYMSNVPV